MLSMNAGSPKGSFLAKASIMGQCSAGSVQHFSTSWPRMKTSERTPATSRESVVKRENPQAMVVGPCRGK